MDDIRDNFLPSASSRDPISCCCATFYNNQFCTFIIHGTVRWHMKYIILSAVPVLLHMRDTCLHQEHATIIKWKSQAQHCSPTERQLWTSNCSYANQHELSTGFPLFKTVRKFLVFSFLSYHTEMGHSFIPPFTNFITCYLLQRSLL